MAFVRTSVQVGDDVILDERVNMIGGYFERGTRMKIVGQSHRGWDLEDEQGNRLNEYGVLTSAKLVKL